MAGNIENAVIKINGYEFQYHQRGFYCISRIDHLCDAKILMENNTLRIQGVHTHQPSRENGRFKRLPCARCSGRPIAMVARPCYCVAICQDCTEEQEFNMICPRCNLEAESFTRVFIGNENEGPGMQPVEMTCRVCLDGPISFMVDNCNHLIICGDCTDRLNATEEGNFIRCPVCRMYGEAVRVNIFE